jgi:phage-related minor tail protein
LFSFCKKSGSVFRNPTGRIPIGERGPSAIQPLRQGEVIEAITTTTTRPIGS